MCIDIQYFQKISKLNNPFFMYSRHKLASSEVVLSNVIQILLYYGREASNEMCITTVSKAGL